MLCGKRCSEARPIADRDISFSACCRLWAFSLLLVERVQEKASDIAKSEYNI